MPVYNMVDTVWLSVESMLSQTCTDWSLIIVDDASTDGTWELLCKEYGSNAKISLHRNEKNLKQWGNLNRCLELARGEWVGFLPADDTYRLHALETVKQEVLKDESLVLWTHAHLCHGEGIVPNIVPVYDQETHFNAGKLAELLYLKGNLFGELSSYFFRLRTATSSGIRFRDTKVPLDYEFWVRLLHSTPAASCMYWPDVLAGVLQHEGSGSSDWIRSGANQRMVLDSIGELGILGWRYPVVFHQYLRAMAFFLRRHSRIPGRRWSLLIRNLRSIKILWE